MTPGQLLASALVLFFFAGLICLGIVRGRDDD